MQCFVPIDKASLPLILRPVNISSFAADLPTILGRRWLPPALLASNLGSKHQEYIPSLKQCPCLNTFTDNAEIEYRLLKAKTTLNCPVCSDEKSRGQTTNIRIRISTRIRIALVQDNLCETYKVKTQVIRYCPSSPSFGWG